jgi:hypothetical protein
LGSSTAEHAENAEHDEEEHNLKDAERDVPRAVAKFPAAWPDADREGFLRVIEAGPPFSAPSALSAVDDHHVRE